MEITPDFSEVTEREPIPPGTYTVRVLEGNLKEGKNPPHRKYLAWTLGVFGAEGELAGYNNQHIYTNTMCEGRGAARLKSFFNACTGSDLDGPFDTDDLVGCEIEIVVAENVMPDGKVSPWPDVKSFKAIQ